MRLAITKIISINSALNGGSYHLNNSIGYITEDGKTEEKALVGAVNCSPDTAFREMLDTKARFGKNDKRQAYHIIISFREGEITPERAFEFMHRFAVEFLDNRFEGVYSVHTDTNHVHGHLVFNSVSFADGKKYHYSNGDWARIIQPLTNRLSREFHIREQRIPGRGDFNTDHVIRTGDDNCYTGVWNDMLRRDVDAAVIFSADFDQLLSHLADMGYQVKKDAKYIAIKPPGMTRYRRLKTLGYDYTEERLRVRVQEENLQTAVCELKNKSPKIRPTYFGYSRRTFRNPSGLTALYLKRYTRAGRLKSGGYAAAWRYKDDIRKLKDLQKKYLYLCEHDLTSPEKLQARRDMLLARKETAARERAKIFYQRKKFKSLFEQAERLSALLECEESFKEGSDIFADEHAEYESILSDIMSQGYTPEKIHDIKFTLDARLAEHRKKNSEIAKELRMLNSIQQDLEKERQKETIQEKEDRRLIRNKKRR